MALTHRQVQEHYIAWITQEIARGNANPQVLLDFFDADNPTKITMMQAWITSQLPDLIIKKTRVTNQLNTITTRISNFNEYIA